MASRKNLKKTVGCILNIASGLCLVGLADAPVEKRGEYVDIYNNIDSLQADILKRINHIEGGDEKLYFKKLNEDIWKEFCNIFTRLYELGK